MYTAFGLCRTEIAISLRDGVVIKSYFSRNCEQEYHQKVSLSRQSKKEQSIWQRRFW
ncbi:hypothetical protein NC991_28875 [Funiculus sociatus GB1-A4]|nr:hypothetical protein [Trichocoleus sp. FACHB-40]